MHQRQNRVAISIYFINEVPLPPCFPSKIWNTWSMLDDWDESQLPLASLKQAVVGRAMVVEGKACQEFISIWKIFSRLYLFQEFFKRFKYSPMKCFRHCFNTNYVSSPWRQCLASIHITVFSTGLILTLAKPILFLLCSLPKCCGWNHYSQNETISGFDFQIYFRRNTAAPYPKQQFSACSAVDNQSMFAK